jgi:hypothetical protein
MLGRKPSCRENGVRLPKAEIRHPLQVLEADLATAPYKADLDGCGGQVRYGHKLQFLAPMQRSPTFSI